jgi:hypothetical protein
MVAMVVIIRTTSVPSEWMWEEEEEGFQMSHQRIKYSSSSSFSAGVSRSAFPVLSSSKMLYLSDSDALHKYTNTQIIIPVTYSISLFHLILL